MPDQRLNSARREALVEILVRAFPDRNDLARLVYKLTDGPLEMVVTIGPLPSMVQDLITKFNSKDQLDAFITCAHLTNPTNRELADFFEDWKGDAEEGETNVVPPAVSESLVEAVPDNAEIVIRTGPSRTLLPKRLQHPAFLGGGLAVVLTLVACLGYTLGVRSEATRANREVGRNKTRPPCVVSIDEFHNTELEAVMRLNAVLLEDLGHQTPDSVDFMMATFRSRVHACAIVARARECLVRSEPRTSRTFVFSRKVDDWCDGSAPRRASGLEFQREAASVSGLTAPEYQDLRDGGSSDE